MRIHLQWTSMVSIIYKPIKHLITQEISKIVVHFYKPTHSSLLAIYPTCPFSALLFSSYFVSDHTYSLSRYVVLFSFVSSQRIFSLDLFRFGSSNKTNTSNFKREISLESSFECCSA